MTTKLKCLRSVNLKFRGVSGCLPALDTRRTLKSDVWTLHSVKLSRNNGADCKLEVHSNADSEMAHPQEGISQLGQEKSEEAFRAWEKFWRNVDVGPRNIGIVNSIQGGSVDWTNGGSVEKETNGEAEKRRYILAMRHGERVDLTYGHWVQHGFDNNGKYTRKDLNLPVNLAERTGGKDSYARDTPLTRVGRLQAYLVGEGLKLAGVQLKHVYSSCALRSVETAHALLEGLGDSSIKIKVEPGIFEHKMWHMVNGSLAPFMTPLELHKAGYNVDLDYKPYVEVDLTSLETLDQFYKRNEKAMQSAVKDTEAEGGNIMFVGHAATLDQMVTALTRMASNRTDYPPYEITTDLLRIPYCAVAAMKDRPLEVVAPPCPPSMNSCSGRYNWNMLLGITN